MVVGGGGGEAAAIGSAGPRVAGSAGVLMGFGAWRVCWIVQGLTMMNIQPVEAGAAAGSSDADVEDTGRAEDEVPPMEDVCDDGAAACAGRALPQAVVAVEGCDEEKGAPVAVGSAVAAACQVSDLDALD